MSTSYRSFLVELYEEHLDEASFLHEQVRALYTNPEVSWLDIGEFEQRLEAHIDALVVGGGPAIDVCTKRATFGDFGDLFTAVCVLCRQNQQNSVLRIMEDLDPADQDKASAFASALKFEMPASWTADFLTLLDCGKPELIPILALAFGYRRIPCGQQLMKAMTRGSGSMLPDIVWALGRITYTPATGALLDLVHSDEHSISSAAVLALARIGEAVAIDSFLERAQSRGWPLLVIGLAGDRRAVWRLHEAAKGNDDRSLIPLGLLGDPASVPFLLSRLEREDVASSAATALYYTTGAELYETVFVADNVDEDELFDEELEQLKLGEATNRGDGRPFGSTIRRLSQSPDEWTRWWNDNESRFTPGVRYRTGALYCPEQLLVTLQAERTPHMLRCNCSEELVTRYGKDLGLETDAPVTLQLKLVTQAASWIQASRARFQKGSWYYAGHQYE